MSGRAAASAAAAPAPAPTEYTPQHVLVTGGAGFIGSAVARYLALTHAEWQLTILDKLEPCAARANLPARCELVVGDVCDAPLVRGLMRERQIDTVLHFAAQSHVDASFADSTDFTRTNVLGTHVMLEAARVGWPMFEPGGGLRLRIEFLYSRSDGHVT